jgi:hypothetical protein
MQRLSLTRVGGGEKPLARLVDLCITRERWRKHDPETLKAAQKGGPRMSGKAGEDPVW